MLKQSKALAVTVSHIRGEDMEVIQIYFLSPLRLDSLVYTAGTNLTIPDFIFYFQLESHIHFGIEPHTLAAIG